MAAVIINILTALDRQQLAMVELAGMQPAAPDVSELMVFQPIRRHRLELHDFRHYLNWSQASGKRWPANVYSNGAQR